MKDPLSRLREHALKAKKLRANQPSGAPFAAGSPISHRHAR